MNQKDRWGRNTSSGPFVITEALRPLKNFYN